MSTLAELRKVADAARAEVLQAEQTAEDLARDWKQKIAAGSPDDMLDSLELEIMRAKRFTERKRVAEQVADAAVTEAERAAAEQEKKQAADEFLKAHAGMQYELSVIAEAAEKFVSLVERLPPNGGAWVQSMMRAKVLGALPNVTRLAAPADSQGAARKAANYANFLNSQML